MAKVTVKEVWRWVKGFRGKYRVSSLGRLKSVKRKCRTSHRGHTGFRTVPERLLGRLNGDGYLSVALCKQGAKKERALIHRLVAKAFIPNPENKPEVNHKDGIKTNNKVSNLEWVTDLEQARHAKLNGLLRPCTGSSNGMSKLSESKVDKIRKMYATGSHRQKDLAKMFSVVQGTISLVVTRKQWRKCS